MDAELVQRYPARVPRYTSYPTAPHFHPGVTAATYRGWLAGIGEDESVSLYLHVPFCARMCWFCGCHTKMVRRYRPVGGYAALVRREVALLAEAIGARPTVTYVHWGGGTPTILSREDFAAVTATLGQHFRFADDAEVAVELDPRFMSEEQASALADCSVTRASLGVQDVNQAVQQAVNRIQPYRVTRQAVAALRGAGIQAINLDLMYGLPRQTVEDVVRTVDLAVRLAPDRLAVFGYAHVPWVRPHQRLIDEAALPDAAERLAQAEAAAARLIEHGYRHIGLDHFARLDDPLTQALDNRRLKRNFQGYTTDRAETLLGLGASSIGTLRQGYVQNAVPVRAWADAIRNHQLAVTRGVWLDDDDRRRRAIIERLMCELAVDLDEVDGEVGAAANGFAAELEALAPMRRDGLVEITGRRVRITEYGRPLMRAVCAVFDRYLSAGEARHSQAV